MFPRFENDFLSQQAIDELRSLPEYLEAYTAKGYIILGREKDTRPYRRSEKYIGRVLNPERRGDGWTIERNAAFWLGAIESQKDFLIVTDLKKIKRRAWYGYDNQQFGIGGSVPELLWLEDNGYHFAPDMGSDYLSYAISPSRPHEVNITLQYNRGEDLQSQCLRVEKIARQVLRAREDYHQSEKFHHASRRKQPLQDATNQLSLFAKPKMQRAVKNDFKDEPNENSTRRRLK